VVEQPSLSPSSFIESRRGGRLLIWGMRPFLYRDQPCGMMIL
jgi:hypothetical protein